MRKYYFVYNESGKKWNLDFKLLKLGSLKFYQSAQVSKSDVEGQVFHTHDKEASPILWS